MDDTSTVQTSRTGPAVQDLMAEFQNLINAMEEVYAAAQGDSKDKLAELRVEAEESLRRARAKLGEMRTSTSARAKQFYSDSDQYVHENPWTAVGLGAGIGLMIGLMIGRR